MAHFITYTKKNGGWFSAAFLRTDCWTVFLSGPGRCCLRGQRTQPAGFSQWCDVASKIPEVSIEIPRIFFGISGDSPKIQLRLGPWVVKHFFAWWFATWWSIVYPIPEVETPNFQGILIIICQKTINHELSSVKHLQLRMISQLQKFWSSFFVDFLLGYQLLTLEIPTKQSPTRHPGHRASIRGWDLPLWDG